MAAVLDHSETERQAAVVSGPPPLGGADPWDRLLAVGRSWLETTLLHVELIREADRTGTRSFAAYSFAAPHVRYLLGDLPLLAIALLAPIEAPVLEQVSLDGYPVDRVYEGWVDLARRIVGR